VGAIVWASTHPRVCVHMRSPPRPCAVKRLHAPRPSATGIASACSSPSPWATAWTRGAVPDAHASATPPLLRDVLALDGRHLPRSATRFVHTCAIVAAQRTPLLSAGIESFFFLSFEGCGVRSVVVVGARAFQGARSWNTFEVSGGVEYGSRVKGHHTEARARWVARPRCWRATPATRAR
jgi:hypothetical protein